MTTLTKQQSRRLRDQLLAAQTLKRVLAGSGLGALAATAVYVALWMMGLPPLIVFIVLVALPGIVAGYITRYTANVLEFRFQMLSGLITFVLLSTAALVLGGGWLTLLLAFPNAITAMGLSRRSLTKEQEHALFLYRMGIEKPDARGRFTTE